MEDNKCVICSSALEESCNGKVDVDMVKTFYDILMHRSSRNILSSVSTDNFWTSIFEFLYFCISCERKVVSIVDLSSDVKSIQTTIKTLVDQIKMKIIKSTSTSNLETRNISKVVAKSNIKKGPTTFSNKIDCFRSLAVIDFNPDVVIIKSEWPTEPLSEDMVHMTKVKFSYFWKMKSNIRSLISSSTISSKPNKSLFCDSFTKREIIPVKGLTKELLTLTKDQFDAYFFYKNEKYKCKMCLRILKSKQYAIKHYVLVHRKIKKWKCGYCGEGYYEKCKCGVHILRDHKHERRTHLTQLIEEDKPIKFIKCIICYTEFMQSNQQETQRGVFFDYCDAMNINYSHPYFQWNSTSVDDIPEFCDSCYSSVVTLCDLDNKRKEMLKSINKIVLQIKTDILVSVSQNGQKLKPGSEYYGPGFCTKDVVDKIDYIRRASIEEFNPDLRLFKVGNYQRLLLHRSSNFNKGQHKHSLFSLLKAGECINLNPGLAETRFPLTDEETGCYLEFNLDFQKYKCRECGASLSSKYSAENHVNKYHKQLKMFECKYCGKQFYQKIDCAYHVVNSHKSERKTDDIIAAPLPKVKLSTPDGIIDLGEEAAPRRKTDDIKKLPNGEGFTCVLCPLVRKSRAGINRHIKSAHYKMARFQCEFCGLKHLHRSRVAYHVQKVHHDEVKRRNIVFESVPASVTKRLEKRHQKRKSRCPVDMTGVNLVERKHSEVDVEDYFTASGVGYTCKQCGILHTSRLRMVYHVESIHLGIRTCECAVCGRRFFKVKTCREHYVRLHSVAISDNSKHALISESDLTTAPEFTLNEHEDISDEANDNLVVKADLKMFEKLSSSNFDIKARTAKPKSMTLCNKPYVEMHSANKMPTHHGCEVAFDETNVNFVKLEAPCISKWEVESEGALIQMESSDIWFGGVSESDVIEKTVFQSEYSETNIKLEQEQEVQKKTDCWNDPLESDGEKDSLIKEEPTENSRY